MQFFERFLGKPSAHSFAKQIVRGIRAAGVTDELRYDQADFRIVQIRDGEEVGSVNLGNLYQMYIGLDRRQRPDHLKHCIRVALRIGHPDLPTDLAEVRPNLRARLWSPSILENLRLNNLYTDAPPVPLDPPCQPIGEHLLACVVYDWPDSVQSLNRENLATWGISVYEALEVAKENLDKSTADLAQIGDRCYSFISGDSYDAARLLLLDRVNQLDLEGSPVVMVPNRETILITGSDDPDGLAIMADLAKEGLEQPYFLSGIPLILDDGEWIDWMPAIDHPCYGRFRDLELNFIGSLCTEQKQLLDAAHERGGIDLFTAFFSALESPDGSQFSFCEWTEGVDALLPVTQKVAFMHKGRENTPLFGEWPRVMEAAGELMELTDHYPRRYRVREFPNKAMLDGMGLTELI